MRDKRSCGQPKFEPTPDQHTTVKIMKGVGMPEIQICQCISNPHTGKPVSPVTLARAFAAELDTGETEMHALVADLLISTILGREPLCGKAIKDDEARVAAAIFFAKCRLGWRETTVHQHEGKDGAKAIIFQVTEADTQSGDISNSL